jgi:hypothetical protein
MVIRYVVIASRELHLFTKTATGVHFCNVSHEICIQNYFLKNDPAANKNKKFNKHRR